MIAYKVTGDKNVPRGEITFQVDLNPLHQKAVDETRAHEEGLNHRAVLLSGVDPPFWAGLYRDHEASCSYSNQASTLAI